MMREVIRTIPLPVLALAVLSSAAWPQQATNAETPYPKMAPVEQYLMGRDAEITLARSAAPDSVSRDAEVMVLGRHGYETAVKGKNGFVCMVERSWTGSVGDADFWNPKILAPICFNPPAARTYLPLTIRKTELVLAGQSAAQMADGIKAALDKKELPPLETGAMCYMLSKQGYLSTRDGHWHPHLMFFVAQTSPKTWGANLPGSPTMASEYPPDRLTIFMVPVAEWSDGTADHSAMH
jgi:hypothetical protein